MTDAAKHWRAALEALAIPPDILARAPESPYGFPVAIFERAADAAPSLTPSRRLALDALPDGGTVLDVGCGAGAASLALVPRAGRIVGVDESRAMLDAFARRVPVEHEVIEGRWPDVESQAPDADVVVCHHVFYNVGHLEPFAAALAGHARSRVVVELTATHPLAWLAPLWRDLHGIERQGGPVADDARAVLVRMGLAVTVERARAPWTLSSSDDLVPFVRRRLCLDDARDDEIRAALDRHPPPSDREIVTFAISPPGR